MSGFTRSRNGGSKTLDLLGEHAKTFCVNSQEFPPNFQANGEPKSWYIRLVNLGLCRIGLDCLPKTTNETQDDHKLHGDQRSKEYDGTENLCSR